MEPKELSFRCIAYREPDGTYTAVCLDLDIVEEGHLTLEEAKLSLDDATGSHLQAAAELGFPKELLHRPAPKQYWKKLEEISSKRYSFPLKLTPFHFFTIEFGQPSAYA